MSPVTPDLAHELAELRRHVRAQRRWIHGLAVAVALLGGAAIRTMDRAVAQPTPPAPPKSLTFVDGDKRVDLDADGLRVARTGATASVVTIGADRLAVVFGDPAKDTSSIELAASAQEAHVKALSDLGSSGLVATPKSLCMSIRQIGGKDSHLCIPPVK